MGTGTTAPRRGQATEETWMFAPADGWTFDQVKRLELHDRVRKPALFAAAEVPCYWRVELDPDQRLSVHEYWLSADTGTYLPAPPHPVHRGKLVTQMPFPVEIGLDALLGL